MNKIIMSLFKIFTIRRINTNIGSNFAYGIMNTNYLGQIKNNFN